MIVNLCDVVRATCVTPPPVAQAGRANEAELRRHAESSLEGEVALRFKLEVEVKSQAARLGEAEKEKVLREAGHASLVNELHKLSEEASEERARRVQLEMEVVGLRGAQAEMGKARGRCAGLEEELEGARGECRTLRGEGDALRAELEGHRGEIGRQKDKFKALADRF